MGPRERHELIDREVAWCYTSATQLKEGGISFPYVSPLLSFTFTTSRPVCSRPSVIKLMISQKQLAPNECVMSDLRDVISVWCAEGTSSHPLLILPVTSNELQDSQDVKTDVQNVQQPNDLMSWIHGRNLSMKGTSTTGQR